jgi:hypothetical protein
MTPTRQEALAQLEAELAELSKPTRSQTLPEAPMAGCLVSLLGIGALLAGFSVLLAVLLGLKRPLRELGIGTPVETGALIMVCGAIVIWMGSTSGQVAQALEAGPPAGLPPPRTCTKCHEEIPPDATTCPRCDAVDSLRRGA